MKVLAIVVLVASAVLASSANAFRSTNFESFTDPDFVGYMPSRIVVLVATTDLNIARQVEARLIEEFTSRGVEAFSGLELFPPTRPIESYNMLEVLNARGIDSALVIEPVGRSTETLQGGSHSTTTFNGNQATTHTNPTVIQTSTAQFTASLLALGKERDQTRTAWYAQIQTDASGWIFVGKKGDAKGAARGIMNGLAEDGHLQPEQPTPSRAKPSPVRIVPNAIR